MSRSTGTGWLHRLRERGVIRVAASYAVIAWLLLQIADVTFEPLGVPRWVMVSLIVAALIGFPVAVALAWFYEASDRGIARDTEAEGVSRPVVHGLRRYLDVVIIGVLLATVATLVVRQSGLGGGDSAGRAIAVLPFKNLSTAAEGDVLASGIAESVMHQLASLAQLDVISRTSAFAFRERAVDAREIGRQLGARYLLEGSVQSDRDRMRVTTQLIDTETGSDVWSMRFDRLPGDVFAIQDEIAVQVTRALELSVDRDAIERMSGQGTTNLKAYLAFLQGRSLLAENRVVDAQAAIEHFEQATRLDAQFAAAYVGQAEAEVFLAEYDVSEDRQERFASALEHGGELVGKALAIDSDNADAWLQRAYMATFDDLAAAEADYRRGLELSPNSGRGYAGLAAVVYQTPSRRDEVLELLDRARRLDPLEPDYGVRKAVFLMYESGDAVGAVQLLSRVLADHPQYLPALVRKCEFEAWGLGESADAIFNCERALAVDPLSEEARRFLVRNYLDLGDATAAQQVAEITGRGSAEIEAPLAMYAHQWEAASELAYTSLTRRTVSENLLGLMLAALRKQASLSGDAHRARLLVEDLAGVSWDADGRPRLPEGSPLRESPIALAHLLILDGEEARGRRLLDEIIARMNLEVGEQGRPEFWFYSWHAVALALHGDRDAALALLERAQKRRSNLGEWWFLFQAEPAFDGLRDHPRFKALARNARTHAERQKLELDRLRREGKVPQRT